MTAMPRVSIDDILDLPMSERVDLVEAIWDSIADRPETVPVTESQKRELDRRLKALENDPDAGDTWANVKESLRGE